MKELVIQTDKLSKSFSSAGRQQHVLKNLDLSIYKGDFTVIMGLQAPVSPHCFTRCQGWISRRWERSCTER